MKRYLIPILISILSAGWLIPLYAAVHNILQYIDAELPILLQGGERQFDYPFILKTQNYASISIVWLFLVILIWSFIGTRRILSTTK